MARFAFCFVAALVLAGAAAAATPDAPIMVGLTVQPGVTLDVPKGWIACDAAANELLGRADDPKDLRSGYCPKGNRDNGFRAFSPKYLEIESMLVRRGGDNQGIADARKASQGDFVKRICDGQTSMMVKQGFQILRCTLAFTTIGGQSAALSTIKAYLPAIGMTIMARIYEVDLPEGHLQLQFKQVMSINTAKLAVFDLDARTKPTVDAIIASVKID